MIILYIRGSIVGRMIIYARHSCIMVDNTDIHGNEKVKKTRKVKQAKNRDKGRSGEIIACNG